MTEGNIAPWLASSRWPTAPIRLVARLGSGHTPSRKVYEYWENCTIPWVTLADVWQLRNGGVDVISTTKEKISELGMANSSAALHPPGTVILSRTASVGFSAMLGADMATSQDFATWTCGHRLDPKFLLHVLRGMAPDLKRVSMGSTHKTIYMPDIEQLRTPLPPLEEQRRIADFLDAETSRIDLLIEKTIRQRELLVERGREQMRIATTTNGEPAVPTGIDWMPSVAESWNLTKVGHAFLAGSGTTPKSDSAEYFDGDYPWINSADLNDGVVDSAIRKVSKRALDDYSALKVHPAGSLVVAMYGQGATKGRVGLLGMDACVNQACCVLSPLGVITAPWAMYWFRSHKEGIVGLALGAGQPNLSQELIRQIKIPTPSIDLQNRIAATLRDFEGEFAVRSSCLVKRGHLLSERRQALITAAVTGQFDVTTASGRNATQGV
ncbi:restriction endonuclease subunit S [Nocardia niwae]|uniref:Restriction endonuclease subunit S n=1 Tax=Nocardia niwae TaxID=626084 RepID=A0ABV2XCZ3_9NOCA|nr:restriction endonuclease subunit S [Nocardia niwae]